MDDAPSETGTLAATTDATPPDGCVASTAGGGFTNEAMDRNAKAMVARFTVTPSASGIDGVVGYSLGQAGSDNDLAASIRFSSKGQIEARDGDAYRATNALPYAAGHVYEVYSMVDITSSTYSVYVGEIDKPSSFTLLADNFVFRTQKVGMPTIDTLSVSSATGSLRVCQSRTTSPANLTAAHPSTVPLASFADGRVVASDANGSSIIGTDGRTLLTSPITLSHITLDDTGNIYDAVATGTTLTIRSFTSTFQLRWTNTYSIQDAPSALGYYGNGLLGIATDDNGTLINIRTTDGAEMSRVDLRAYQPTSVAIGAGRYAFGWRTENDGVVEMHAVDGTKLWERRWTANFDVTSLVMDRAGAPVFAGTFGDGGVDFGDGHYDPIISEEDALNGYLVALQPDGSLRFSKRPVADAPDSLSADGDMIGYGVTRVSAGPTEMQLFAYDAQGGEHQAGELYL
ncbi:MAG TPA: hypothetical protein VGM39_10965, partial [Kofleriaceae bacterium]